VTIILGLLTYSSC